MLMCWPRTSSGVYPKIFSAPGLNSVILCASSIVIMASSEICTTPPKRSVELRRAANVLFNAAVGASTSNDVPRKAQYRAKGAAEPADQDGCRTKTNAKAALSTSDTVPPRHPPYQADTAMAP